MRGGALLPLALTGLVLLAGCAADQVDDTDIPVADTIPVLTQTAWGMENCAIAVGLFGVDAAKVQPFVPEGFTVMSPPQVVAREGGLPAPPPNPTELGNFGIEMFTCTSGTGLDGPIEDMVYGSLFTAVTPPESMHLDGAKHAFVKWDVLIPDQARRDWLVANGVPAVDGTAAFSTLTQNGPTFAMEGRLLLGADEYAFTARGLAPLAEDGSFVEYTDTPAGLVRWSTEYTWIAGTYGEVEVTVPATGLAAQVLGAGTQTGAGFVGIANFVDGTITLPGAAMGMGHGH